MGINKIVDRRDFLKVSALSTFGFLAATGMNLIPGAKMLGLGSEACAAASDHTVLYVFCRGAMDTLSWFPPNVSATTLRASYEAKRPNIKFNANAIDARAFGVNPELPAISDLLASHDLTVILGIGSINNTTSHFTQMDYIEGGNSVKRESIGMFQKLAVAGAFAGTTDLVAVESTIPRSLRGQNFVFQYRNPTDVIALAGLGVSPGVSKADRLNKNFGSLMGVNHTAQAMAIANDDVYAKVRAVPLAAMPMGELAEAGRMIVAGVNPKVMTVSIDGWDFHSDLKARMVGANGLATKFTNSLKTLVDQLKAAGKWSTTTIVVMSEFGRRMVENGALGCDHGRGGHMLVLSGSLRNGGRIVYKPDYPNRVNDLFNVSGFQQSNLPVDYDYRALLGEIFAKRFGVVPAVSNTAVFGEVVADNNMLNILA